ncbi:hypothetical protein [Microbacterium sp. JAI119]|uniref:hypothetical protein n=1 Tax=Microbacterium sp. JAI119 TaxID=2723062 RepID=UPI0015CCD890|nr:hypothetical protein [Microbacterium sp. JAI119]NYF29236.1 hypothetical protein [Microbacterium sp. JAI119]
MSVRKDVEAQLGADWADIPPLAALRVIATERELDDITQPTALIRAKSYDRTPAAPQSHRNVGLLLTLISPHLDLDRAGDQLDDITTAALDYLDTRFSHEQATAVGYGARLAFDIPLTVIASKE